MFSTPYIRSLVAFQNSAICSHKVLLFSNHMSALVVSFELIIHMVLSIIQCNSYISCVCRSHVVSLKNIGDKLPSRAVT